MSFALPKPKRMTHDEVVLSRDDWDRVVLVLGESPDEDDDDIAAVAAAREEDARFWGHAAAGRGRPPQATVPIEVVKAKLDGVHPIRAWRDHREMTQMELSARSQVGRDLIAQIETRKKTGSVGSLSRLAQALDLPIDALIEDD
jgi:antitoxin component HigA of HigAB toxin-antitoxin module